MTIRRVPEDFIVEERSSPEYLSQMRDQPWTGATAVVYELTKTSLTTPEAVQRLAKSIGVKPGVVDYGGLKDKHARTTQLVSVPFTGGVREKQSAESVGDRGWSAVRRGWHSRPINAAEIAGNEFTIVVRDLSAAAAKEMGHRAALLAFPQAPNAKPSTGLLIVNYFGDQRFGSARHGHGFAATHLVRGEFEQALKLLIATPARKDSGKTRLFTRTAAGLWGQWNEMLDKLPRCAERGAIEALAAGKDFRDAFASLPYFTQQICVEAYQSYLWNQIAAKLARRIAGQTPAERRPLLEADDDFGTMLFPTAGSVSRDWIDVQVPTLGPEAVLHEPWRAAAAEVLATEDRSLEQLRIPGLRRPAFGAADRPLLVCAGDFSLSTPEPDEMAKAGRLKRTLRFHLARGAYATVVLRALGQ